MHMIRNECMAQVKRAHTYTHEILTLLHLSMHNILYALTLTTDIPFKWHAIVVESIQKLWLYCPSIAIIMGIYYVI